MFSVEKPQFTLVTDDVLTYRCHSHNLIYDDLRMIYNHGLATYQRDRFDGEWRRVDNNQVETVDLEWLVPTRFDCSALRWFSSELVLVRTSTIRRSK